MCTARPFRFFPTKSIQVSIEVYDASNNIFNPLTAEEIYDNLEVEKSKQEEEMLSNGAIEAAESNAKSALTDILRLSGKVDGYTIGSHRRTDRSAHRPQRHSYRQRSRRAFQKTQTKPTRS